MKKKTASFSYKGQTRLIILIFVLLAALMVSSSLIELRQSKKELYELMAKQAHSLLESLITASQNTLRATNYLDDLARQRLLDNANLIRILYEQGNLNNPTLTRIAEQNHIVHIHLFHSLLQLFYRRNKDDNAVHFLNSILLNISYYNIYLYVVYYIHREDNYLASFRILPTLAICV